MLRLTMKSAIANTSQKSSLLVTGRVTPVSINEMRQAGS